MYEVNRSGRTSYIIMSNYFYTVAFDLLHCYVMLSATCWS